MAQAPKKPESGSGADFVSSIVTDPKSVPDVMRLYGYLGASSEEGHERLYLNPDLTNYVEVPTQAILHRMTVPAEQDPHGAVCLWVKKDAALIYKMTPAAQALAHYFAGAIQAGTAGAAAAPVAGAAPQTVFCPTPPVTVLCPRPTVIWCQTPACTFAGPVCMSAACPTHYPTCALFCTQIVSCVAICQTQVCQFETAACPQITLACPQPSLACGPGGQAGFARQATQVNCTNYVTCGQECLIRSEIPGQTCAPAGGCGQAGFAWQVTQVNCTNYVTCGQECLIRSEIPGQTCAPAGGCGQAGFARQGMQVWWSAGCPPRPQPTAHNYTPCCPR